jgi:diguanylate cyclase (GGDEF)-like protein/PAS domain S-box-containing protein
MTGGRPAPAPRRLQLSCQIRRSMHKLIQSQLAEATAPDGQIDVARLVELVSAAYSRADSDREANARALSATMAGQERAHRRLLDALEVVPEGIAVFDAEDRFVMWNSRYAEMYPNAGRLAVGMRFEEFLRERLKLGSIPEARGREEDWLAQRLARHRQPAHVEEQRFGEDQWLRIEERRTAEGGSITVRVDITELKRREASFRLLFESNPLPMWVSDRETLKFLAVNDAAIAHYGYSRDQFMAMTLLDIRSSEFRERLRIAVTTDTFPVGDTWQHLKADGTAIDVAIYKQTLTYEGRPAHLIAIVDLSERKQAERELRDTREFLNTIVENVPAMIVVKDAADLRYVFINRAGEEIYGLPRERFLGKTARDVHEPATAELVLSLDRQTLASGGEMVSDEYTLVTPNKTKRVLSSKRLPIFDGQGRQQYLLNVTQDVTDRYEARARIAYMAHHDPLTDLPNRAAFNEQIKETMRRAAPGPDRFGIISIDVDRFKQINDVFSHSAGDSLLREVGRRLNGAAGDAFLARVGGDEFTLIVEDGPQPAATLALAERLQAAMAEPFEIAGQRVSLGLSIGIAIFPLDGTDAATLLGNADAALYRAKAAGRGTIQFFEPDMDQQLRARRALQHDLQLAVERNEFVLHFQPQARIDSTIVGFEALVRWQHPVRGMISPATFIPLAEESGIIREIGEWVLREACREAAAWPHALRIAVNLSPVQFEHGDLPSLVHTTLLETGLSPQRLELEITEGVLIGDSSRAVAILRRLKSLGVRVAMDDFGSGYSSLSYLQAFPFDKIKIDQSFISSVQRNPQSAAIIRAVIGLGHGLGLPVLAEGVESEEQMALLAAERCDEVQGFLIGRPQPIGVYAGLVGRPTEPVAIRQAV